MQAKAEQIGESSDRDSVLSASTQADLSPVSTLALKAAGLFVGKHFIEAYGEMRRAQWFSAEKLESRANKRLSILLNHAAQNVPFYRDYYHLHGIGADELKKVADLSHLPIVNKAFYRAQPPTTFEAGNLPAYRQLEKTTSGSTGEPFRFSVDRQALPTIFASHLFYDSWFDLRPFDRYVRIMAPPAEAAPLPRQTPAIFRLRQTVTSRLQRFYEERTQRKLWLWEVSATEAEKVWREMESFKPRFVMGYTSTLAALCDEWLRRGLHLTEQVRGVMTIAETLTPTRRKLIENYFHAPIINRYGMREFGSWSAQSCPAKPDHFHINTELVICEVVREDGSACSPGETGRVVLTDLHNFVRPFIRYETGDLAVAASGRCQCGRGFPLLGAIEGRSLECLRTPAGREINPVTLGHYLFVYHRYQDAVRQYQLVQEAADQVRMLIVPDHSWNVQRGAQMQTDLQQLIGDDVRVSVETVAQIAPEKSGKRPIIKVAAASAKPTTVTE